ncbi:MAG: hypothetical protein WCV84_06145, partial [Patescibacteria group bacterium]
MHKKSNRHLLWIAFCLTLAGMAWAQDLPANSSNATADLREHFGNSVLMHMNFDDTTTAQIARDGLEEPLPKASNSEVQYMTGVRGKALVPGKAFLTYDPGQELHLSEGGAVAFWLNLVQFGEAAEIPSYFAVSLFAPDGLAFVGQVSGTVNARKLHASVGLWVDKANVQLGAAGMGSTKGWVPGDWHLLVANWKADAVEFSVDGMPPVRTAFKSPLSGTGGTKTVQLRVGDYNASSDEFAIDEVIVFDKPLSENDIDWLLQ